MAPSTIYTRASASLTPLSNPLTRQTLISARIHRYHNAPVRSLWWWGSHGSWSPSPDESMEERLQRHRKIMRHRYSRSLRRRAMWDRDDNSSSLSRGTDNYLGRRWGACTPVSSMDALLSKSDDKHGEHSARTRTEPESVDPEFEAFKAAIDRAVQQDACGTLFGRRSQGPLIDKNSSLISWFFNRENEMSRPTSKRSIETGKKKIEIEVLDEDGSIVKPAERKESGTKTSMASTSVESMDAKYVYDPISGRKVLRKASESESGPQGPQPLLDILFSEHGYRAPSQRVRHHKVHGYTGETSKVNVEPNRQGKAVQSNAGFPSSRAHEYQQLRAATLGNSIDTSAEFYGKVQPEAPPESETPREKIRRMPEFDEDAPLFSGTAHDTKLTRSRSGPDMSWLVKEGFQGNKTTSDMRTQESGPKGDRLEPSFDRMRLASEENTGKKFTTKLQPAVDRIQIVKLPEPSRNISRPLEVASPASSGSHPIHVKTSSQCDERDMKEDIDLLRASDIRAATKSMRTTKQEVAQAKQEKRSRLNNDFNQLHSRSEESVPDAAQLRAESDRLSQSIDTVRKHAERYPDGMVATTIKSIGIFGQWPKDGDQPSSTPNVSLTTQPETETNQINGNNQASHRWATKLVAYPETHSLNMNDEGKAQKNRRESSKLTGEADAATAQNNVPILDLTGGIHRIYKAEQGPMNLSPAQNSTNGAADVAKTLDRSFITDGKVTTTTEAQSGVKMSDLPTEHAKLVIEINQVHDDANVVRKRADDFLQQLGSSIVGTHESELDSVLAEARSVSGRVGHLEIKVDEHIAKEQATKRSHPHPLSTATVKPGVSRDAAIERHTTMFEPRYIQMLFNLKSATKQLQEISGSIDDLRSERQIRVDFERRRSTRQKMTKPIASANQVQSNSQSTTKVSTGETVIPSSSYLILVYNKTTGEIDQTEMQRLPWAATEKLDKVNPIAIMGNLNNPAAFVTHFVHLETAGYELASGGGDVLVFQKPSISVPENVDKDTSSIAAPARPGPIALRNAIAKEEASAQPEISEIMVQSKTPTAQQAASVLDEIPAEIPKPGPAAPVAPVKKTPRPGPKVRRQEQVFSGTLPLRSATDTMDHASGSSSPHQSGKQSRNRGRKSSNPSHTDESTDPSFISRAARTVRRGIVGATAIGVAAYTIGAVAEGIGAQAQVEGDNTLGPRRRVVMPTGQRAGIYSTESSRD